MTPSPAQAQLFMRTYFSTTIEAALDLARRELGSDALLVKSRPAPEEVRHLGRYEVIFATEREQILPVQASPSAEPNRAAAFIQHLEAAGIEPALARDLVYSALRQTSAPFFPALKKEMERRLKINPRLGSVVALIGPPGRGKTTTAAKLAISEGLARGVSVRILSVDDNRIGASDRLRSLSASLQIPFQLCRNVEALDRELRTNPGLILIDTPGNAPRDFAESADLSSYLNEHPRIDVHLVLRADAKSADLLRTVQKYSDFGTGKLLFTGIDEIDAPGSVFSAAVQTGHPVSFLGLGQRIPQDLEAASVARIFYPIFKGWEGRTKAAA
jgi:flagellar biosynthesis protein FlhF